jgi:hypothetical protein
MFIKVCKGMKMCENHYLSAVKEENHQFEDRFEYTKFSEVQYGAFHNAFCLHNLFFLLNNHLKYRIARPRPTFSGYT